LDDFLNLVLARPNARAALLDFLQRVGAADGFHLFVLVVVFAIAVTVVAMLRVGGGRFGVGGKKFAAGLGVVVAAFRYRRRRESRVTGRSLSGFACLFLCLEALRLEFGRGRLVDGQRGRGV